jgi:hypothetical protein
MRDLGWLLEYFSRLKGDLGWLLGNLSRLKGDLSRLKGDFDWRLLFAIRNLSIFQGDFDWLLVDFSTSLLLDLDWLLEDLSRLKRDLVDFWKIWADFERFGWLLDAVLDDDLPPGPELLSILYEQSRQGQGRKPW